MQRLVLCLSSVCIGSCSSATTERRPSSELQLINENQWQPLFTEIAQRPEEHGIGGSNGNDGIRPCLQWALDETPLKYYHKQRKMHMADQSKQVCLRTRNEKRQLTTTRCFVRSGDVVCMQIITTGNIVRWYADVPPSCLVHDVVY